MNKSAYGSLESDQWKEKDSLRDKIWHWDVPQRIKTHLWLICHGRLLTNGLRFQRHLSEDPFCYRCKGVEENLSHALPDCFFARRVWETLIGRDSWRCFRTVTG